MKIVYYSDMFFPSVNGVVTSLANLAQGMVAQGHEVAIVFPKPGLRKSVEWGEGKFQLVQLPSVPAIIYPDVRVAAPSAKSLLLLRRFRPDVIHVQTPAMVGVDGLMGGRLLKTPVVGTFHGYHMEPEYLQLVHLDKVKAVSRALWRVTVEFYNQCSRVIALSQTVKADMLDHGVDDKITVIPNGMDLSFVEEATNTRGKAVQKKYGLGEHVVLYVGRISKEKNLKMLVKAFKSVLETFTGAQLVLVGDGPFLPELKEYAASLDIRGEALFLGAIPHDELLSSGIYQASRVFATASTSEVQPMSVIEAMASGLPVVGMAARGMKGLVGENGILVKPGDLEGFAKGIQSFLDDTEKCKIAGRKSRELAQKHSIERVVGQTEELYKSLVS